MSAAVVFVVSIELLALVGSLSVAFQLIQSVELSLDSVGETDHSDGNPLSGNRTKG